MLPVGTICKWHNDQKAICSARISKKLSHTICSLDKFSNLITFCDENARKFQAKLWFQNLLAAKLSFQSLNVLVVYAPQSRVKRGKTMLPTVAKLLVKLHTPVTQPIVLPRWKIWEALIQRGYIEVVEIVFVSRLQNSKLNIIDSTRCFRYYPYNSKLLVV